MWWQTCLQEDTKDAELTALFAFNLHQKSDLTLGSSHEDPQETQTQRQGAERSNLPSKLERDAGIRERN